MNYNAKISEKNPRAFYYCIYALKTHLNTGKKRIYFFKCKNAYCLAASSAFHQPQAIKLSYHDHFNSYVSMLDSRMHQSLSNT